MANCKIPAWDKSGKYIYFTASTDYGMNVGWLDMSSMTIPWQVQYTWPFCQRNKVSFSSSKWWWSEKESDNTKSKNKKNDADEEKADKAKIEPVKIDFEGLQQRSLTFLQNLYAIRSCKGSYPLFRTRTQ
jgi:tricorn protease